MYRDDVVVLLENGVIFAGRVIQRIQHENREYLVMQPSKESGIRVLVPILEIEQLITKDYRKFSVNDILLSQS